VLKKAQRAVERLGLDRSSFSVIAEQVTAEQRLKAITATYGELREKIIRLLGEGQKCLDTMETRLLTVARTVEENEDVNRGISRHIERSVDGGN
jgi:hypothetical protein